MGAFYLGLFFGLFINEGLARDKNSSLETTIQNKIAKLPIVQWMFVGIGIGLMGFCMALIYPYLDIDAPVDLPKYEMMLAPLGFVFGLGLFVLPVWWECSSTRPLERLLGWEGWVHFDKIAVVFYLITPMVIGVSTYSSQNSIYYDMVTVFSYFLGDLFSIYIITVLIVACFENQINPIAAWLQIKILGEEQQFSDVLVEEL
jgi:hypothetical protein